MPGYGYTDYEILVVDSQKQTDINKKIWAYAYSNALRGNTVRKYVKRVINLSRSL